MNNLVRNFYIYFMKWKKKPMFLERQKSSSVLACNIHAFTQDGVKSVAGGGSGGYILIKTRMRTTN